MKDSRVLAGAACALVFGLAGCGSQEATKEQVVDAEIERFHRLWNADEFKAVYDDAHVDFRNARTDDEAVAFLERLKRDYGPFKSAKIRSSQLLGSDYRSYNDPIDLKLNYDSDYERGSAVEVFVYRITGTQALLVRYDILSPEAAKKHDAEEKARREQGRNSEKEKP